MGARADEKVPSFSDDWKHFGTPYHRPLKIHADMTGRKYKMLTVIFRD